MSRELKGALIGCTLNLRSTAGSFVLVVNIFDSISEEDKGFFHCFEHFGKLGNGMDKGRSLHSARATSLKFQVCRVKAKVQGLVIDCSWCHYWISCNDRK